MASLEEEFKEAAETLKNLKSRPTDEELLMIYALFKQGSEGDVNIPRPGLFDLKGKAKWDAWNEKKGMSKEEAQRAYVARVKQMVEMYGMKE